MKIEASSEVSGVARTSAARRDPSADAGFGAVLEKFVGETGAEQEAGVVVGGDEGDASDSAEAAVVDDGSAAIVAVAMEEVAPDEQMDGRVDEDAGVHDRVHDDDHVHVHVHVHDHVHVAVHEDAQREGIDDLPVTTGSAARAVADVGSTREGASLAATAGPTRPADMAPPGAPAAHIEPVDPAASSISEPRVAVATASTHARDVASASRSATVVPTASTHARDVASASRPGAQTFTRRGGDSRPAADASTRERDSTHGLDARIDTIAEAVHRAVASPSFADASVPTAAPATMPGPAPTSAAAASQQDAAGREAPDPAAIAAAAPHDAAIAASSPSTVSELPTIEAAATARPVEVGAPPPGTEPMRIAVPPSVAHETTPAEATSPGPDAEMPEAARTTEPVMQQRIDRIRTALEQLRPIPDGGVAVDVDLDGFGRIELRVEPVDGGLRVSLGTDEPTALARLEAHRSELEAALRNPGDALALDIHAHGRRARTPRPHAQRRNAEPTPPDASTPITARGLGRGLVDVVA